MSAFPQVSIPQSGRYIIVNENFEAVIPANFSGIRRAAVAGLTLALFGGLFWDGSAVQTLGDTRTTLLAASATNYVEENLVTGAITDNAVGFSASGQRALYTIITTATGIPASVTDHRRIAWQDAQARFNRIDIATLAITTNQPAIKATQTWNAGGTTFVAHDTAITVTAAAAGSLLARWQAGAAGATLVAQLGHLGLFELPLALSATTGIRLGADVDLYRSAANILRTPDSLTVDGNLTVSGTGTSSVGGLLDVSGASAGQIKFPATQNASADANTLDDYEESNSWTPTGNGVTLTVNTATYTKKGREVTAQFDVTWPTTADGGAAQILSFPFTAMAAHFGAAVMSSDHTSGISGFVSASTSRLDLYSVAGGVYSNANLSTRRIIGTAVYFV